MFTLEQARSIIALTGHSKTFPEQLDALASLIRYYEPSSYLEVGAFQGRSLGLFSILCSSLGSSEILVTSIDSWLGGDEHKSRGYDMSVAESCYNEVAKICTNVLGDRLRVEKIKSFSRPALSRLAERKTLYDLILVDAGHKAKDVLEDLIYSWPLLKEGGILIVDDYTWIPKHSNQGNVLLDSPKLGIDAFLNCYSNEVKIISNFPLLQLYCIKEAPMPSRFHYYAIPSEGIPEPLNSLVHLM